MGEARCRIACGEHHFLFLHMKAYVFAHAATGRLGWSIKHNIRMSTHVRHRENGEEDIDVLSQIKLKAAEPTFGAEETNIDFFAKRLLN